MYICIYIYIYIQYTRNQESIRHWGPNNYAMSALRPVLSCIYIMHLEEIIFHHGLHYMIYADDIQLHITCDGDHVPTGTIEECVGEIRNWKRISILAMEDKKAEVIHFSNKFHGHGPATPCDLQVGGVRISSYDATCNLGAMMDSAGTMSNVIAKAQTLHVISCWRRQYISI